MPGSGTDVFRLGEKHVGDEYVFGVSVPKDNKDWTGPWDCAEFASWLVFQVSGKLFGCNNDARPSVADAFTGYWARDARDQGCDAAVEKAAGTKGAFLLRFPQESVPGHIVVADGAGGTVEAHSTKRGVIRGTLQGRRWDIGILPPMIAYDDAEPVPVTPPEGRVFTLQNPNQKDPLVRRLQQALKATGLSPGPIDGAYGPMTVAAVKALQLQRGLVVDGEAGPQVAKVLGMVWS